MCLLYMSQLGGGTSLQKCSCSTLAEVSEGNAGAAGVGQTGCEVGTETDPICHLYSLNREG